MPDLKLAKLPDRTPIKMALVITPELHHALLDYAALYAAAYGREETVAELVPAMLLSFQESDKAFVRARQSTSGRG